MTYTLVYLDSSRSYHHWYFSAADQLTAESIALHYCLRSGLTFADLLMEVL